MLVDPALVTAVLGGVDRGDERAAEAAGEVVAGVRDQPVVAVDEVEFVAVAELDPTASMSEFIRSTQATNSLSSAGRVGSITRWT